MHLVNAAKASPHAKFYGLSTRDKRLRTSESNASRVTRVVSHCLQLSWKSLF